ncbi:Acetate--CoA ligase [ADP-forming] II subunit alpha [Candidatus Tiddalikarchaeum anstoanum]|nr:Acetate--CoA ligase [ADP-forming] II subunit alpha [Candidatus Tiddalikarchaeum anstoanum]
MNFFDALFDAKIVAVIGASNKKGKVGTTVFNNLLRSGVNVIPVNINTKWIGVHKSYEKITDYQGVIDLAIICIPAQFVPRTVEECGHKGIHSVIIISSGFAEVGNKELNDELERVCKTNNVEVLGPNCLGVINCKNKLNASFFKKVPKYDTTAFISQSGALGTAVLDKALLKNEGFSKFISVGNMLNTQFHEIIEYLNQDPETEVICMYVESLKKGRDFIRVVKHTKKPLIILKAGRSESGAKAASSHTGSLAGSSKVYDGIFKQFNILSVNTLDELFSLAKMIKTAKKPESKNVCIVTNAGGPGVLASDACENFGLTIAALPENLKAKLNEKLPSNWSHNNPIDVIGDAMSDRYIEVFKNVSNKDFYSILLCILTPQDMTEPEQTANAIIHFEKENKDKSVFTCFMGGERLIEAKKILEQNNIINFEEPYDFARIVSKL